MVRPLDGLLVVSLEQAIAAPYCTRMLADNGARVIKIERPMAAISRGPTTPGRAGFRAISSGPIARRRASRSM